MRKTVYIKPSSKKGPPVLEGGDGVLTVYVLEPAVDGKANAALIAILAKHYGVSKTNICIVRGATARRKAIEIID